MAIEINSDEEFQNLIKENKLSIVNFYTNNNQCSKIAPIFDSFSETYSELKFLKVNCDTFEELSESFNVEAVPTFIIFDSGQMTNKRSASKNVNLLLNLIKSVSKEIIVESTLHEVIREDDFQRLLNTKQTTIVEFYADWCLLCRKMMLTFEKCSEKYTDIQFLRVNVDNLSEISRDANIKAIPAYVIFEMGVKTEKQMISTKIDELIEFIQSVSNLKDMDQSGSDSLSNSSSSDSTLESQNVELSCIMGKQIGIGSSGVVNICTDSKTGVIYAVKHISFDRKTLNDLAKKVN
jgi:thioredoxin 1